MARKLWVGGLSRSVDDDALRALFESFGPLGEVTVVRDRASGRSRGFGFVSFVDDARGMAAIEQMDGRELAGRRLSVRLAREPSGTATSGRLTRRREDARRVAQPPAPPSLALSQLAEPIESWTDDRPRRRPDRKRKRRKDHDDDDFEREPRRPRGGRSRRFDDQDEW